MTINTTTATGLTTSAVDTHIPPTGLCRVAPAPDPH